MMPPVHFHGTFHDGVSAGAHRVAIEPDVAGIRLVFATGEVLRRDYASLVRRHAPRDLLRLGSGTGAERIEIIDRAIAERITALGAGRLGQDDAASRSIVRVVGWSLVAGASLLIAVLYVLPALSAWAAPLVPPAMEQRLGDIVTPQVEAHFGGRRCSSASGSAALGKLVHRLSDPGSLHVPLRVAVLDSKVVNAVALPGGRVYVMKGLLDRAGEPDALAGVLAHEIGHVAHRDGLKALIHSGSTGFLLGLLFGDVTGAGVAALVTKLMITSSFSRAQELEADRFAAERLRALGRSARPLGLFLGRISEPAGEDAPSLLSSHPASRERLAALKADAPSTSGPSLLSADEWQALRTICDHRQDR